MFDSAVRAALAAHAETFRTATPFRHVVIDGFLRDDVARAMLQAFPGFDPRYAKDEHGRVGGKAVREHVRELPEPYPQLDAWLASADFLDAISVITGIPDLRHDPDYVGGGTHENVDGQALEAHVDFNYHPRTGQHRRLNLIVYLNPEWDEAWGGVLELSEDPWSANPAKKRIVPRFNRAVLFETSEQSWHGFPRITLPVERRGLSRRSFAIYLYTDERPAEETAPPHATVYVPEARPEHLVAGHVLAAADVAELDRRFAAARGQLQFLYGREKEDAQRLANLQRELMEARAAWRPPLLGHARAPQPPQGLWPDGWCEREAALTLVPAQPVTGLEVVLWVPPALHGARLSVRAGEVAAELVLQADTTPTLSLALCAGADAPLPIILRTDSDWQPDGDARRLAVLLRELRLHHA
ncbi:2OG-Fe(II) oxygenase [Arenimonas composti]|uniref:Prolyl 4-hydroxylase alpha subunit Fe(2+) 2OG dioxygenase domain-containing protein n=1 Tax=Arenimonas composti TR7-09 = DSM 18010 TaxID=1121013 RepID=A0A091BDN4_9GAMM|nr:2OG-Fe(II) oxygenase [Arenimonas composti]KFN49637.1 hypothetical protein P873_09730 [Arenimonas composti TR7-09 = DSM 18010]